MGKINAFFVWFIAIIIAIFSGWLFKTDDLAVMFAGFVLFCFSATLAGYQINKARAAKKKHCRTPLRLPCPREQWV
jgi:membrane protein implicated in regulation of membrane protease activity